MKRRTRAAGKNAGQAGTKPMAMASAAPKRMDAAKKSAPKKKKAPPAKKAAAPAKKPVPVKKPAVPAAKPAPAAPRLATPIPSAGQAPRPAAPPPRPNAPPPRPATAQSVDERRKAATRKFFARLRSLEAIVGADLRKRGSLVLMQAVDQWYNEAISVSATDVSITNAAKAVIAHL
ncbi:MAG TPA: hypothetical protein VMA53_24130 [Stellaceae bacterium]|nr:hypothetical protein [Stellaceae bacterium]